MNAHRTLKAPLTGAILTLLPVLASAATLTWNGGGGSPSDGNLTSWDASTSNWWNGAGTTWSAGSDAWFGVGTGSTTAYSVSVGFAPSVGNVTFANQAYTLTGGTLSLLATGTSTITVSASAATISSSLAGTTGFIKSGTGTLTLSGSNTISGVALVSAGTLALGNVNALRSCTLDTGSAGSQLVTFTVGGANTYTIGGLQGLHDLATGSNSLTVGINNASTTFSGNLTVNSLFKQGNGTLTLTGTNAISTDIKFNAGGGGIAVSSGTTSIGGGLTLADFANGTLTVSGGTVALTGGSGKSFRIGNQSTGTLNVSSGLFSIVSGEYMGVGDSAGNSGNSGTGIVTVTGGTASIQGDSTQVINLAQPRPNGTASGAFAGTVNFSGGVFATARTLMTGTNTGAGTKTSNINFKGGTLQSLGNNSNWLDASLTTVALVSGTSTIDTNGFYNTIGHAISGTGNLIVTGAGALTLSATNTYSGVTTIQGALSITATSALPNCTVPDKVVVSSGGILAIGNSIGDSDLAALVATGSNFRAGASMGFDTTGGDRGYTVAVADTAQGALGLAKLGSNKLTLSAASSYTGPTTINAGTLNYGILNALGSGTVTFSGNGALQAGVDGVVANNFVVNPGVTGTLDTQASAVTLSGIFSGSGNLTKMGAGTLILTASSTLPGVMTVAAGVLQLGDGTTDGALVSGSLVNNTSLIFNPAVSQVASCAISGTGTLTKTGAGITTLSGSNSFTGTALVNAGTLALGNVNALKGCTLDTGTAGSQLVTFTVAGTYNIGGLQGANNLAAGGNSLLVGTNNANTTFSGNITAGSLSKQGTGTLTLTGNNTFGGMVLNFANSGAITVSSGTTSFASSTIGDFATGTINVSGGTVLVNGGNGKNLLLGNQGTGTVNVSSGLFSVVSGEYVGIADAAIVYGMWGTGTITVTGGTASFLGDSTQAINLTQPRRDGVSNGAFLATINLNGGVFATARTLMTGTNAISGAGTKTSIVNFNGGTLRSLGNNTNWFDAGLTTVALASGTSTIDTNGYSNTINHAISGTGSLIVTGSGMLTLSGTSTYTGSTTIASGTLQLGNGVTDGAIPTTNILNNGALAYNTVADRVFSGVVSGSGGLTKSGSGTLTLTGLNTYTGVTTVNGGVLELGDGTPSGDGSLATSGMVVNNLQLHYNYYNDQTIGYPISGNGTVWKQGPGTLTLTASSNLAGAVSVISGTLQLGDGTVGHDGSLSGANILTNAGTILFNGVGNQVVASAISGIGSITKTGTNTVTLSGTSNYTGVTTIAGGVLNYGKTTALGSGTAIFAANSTLQAGVSGTVANNMLISPGVTATMDSQNYTATFAGNIAGSGSFTKIGTGTVILAGSNSYTGITRINAGTLQVGSLNALGASGTIAFGGGKLQYSSGNTVDYSSRFSSASSQYFQVDTNGQAVVWAANINNSSSVLSKNGAGALTLTGSNNVGVKILGGELVIDGLTNSAGCTVGDYSNGTLTISSGTFATTSGAMVIGNQCAGVVNVNGGVLSFASGAQFRIADAAGVYGMSGIGTVNVAGGTITALGDSTQQVILAQPRNDGVSAGNYTGTINFNSGVFETARTFAKGTNVTTGVKSATLNFNGGTLRALGDNANWFNASLDAVTLASGTSTIDSNGFSVAIGIAMTGSGGLVKSGNGVLTLTGNNSYNGGTTVNSGTLRIGSDAALGAVSGTVTLSNGALQTSGSCSFNASLNFVVTTGTGTFDTQGYTSQLNGSLGGAGVLAKSGSGTLTLAGSVNVGGLNADTGIVELAQSGSIGAVSVAAGATLSMAAHNGSTYNVLDTSSLTLSGSTSTLNLWNNAMILRASGTSENAINLATVKAAVNTASDGLRWDGVGIGSTTAFNEAQPGKTQALALMVYDNRVITQSSFEGVSGFGYFDSGSPVGFNQVLVKLTYLGDFNADGVINASDYTWLDGFALSGNTLGDLNGDGQVNATDYTWLDGSALNQSFGVLAAQQNGGSGISSTSLAPNAAAIDVTSSMPDPVPEPGTLGFLIAGVTGLFGRRSRTRRHNQFERSAK